MAIKSFGEYRPDVSDYNGQTTKNILNVVPKGDGYGPFLDLTSISSALGAACRGYFYARKNDGSIAVFAGTSTKLYILNNSDGTWTDVSLSGGTYSTLSSTAQWQFVQFNNLVFATQVNDVLQVYDLASPSTFVAALGSPPQAAYIAVVNRFLVLSGLSTSDSVYRIRWSGLNDVNSANSWQTGVNSSDFQDLADGGIVRGVAGGESGYIFQDQSIRQMTFAPGSSYVFGISRVSQDDGLFAPYSLISAGDRILFYSPHGFKMLVPGGYPTPIGKERVDTTFLADLDTANTQLFIGANDPRSTRVFWAYKSVNGAPGSFFDKMLCYDWALDKWSTVIMSGEYIASLSQPGLTLEQTDLAYSSRAATFTATAATNLINRTAHGFVAGNQVTFGTTGTLPAGLSITTPYFVIASGLTSDVFKVSATFGGSEIDITDTGTGTHYLPTIDSMSLGSLDDVSIAVLSKISAVSSTHKLGFFTGSTLEATLETPEQGADGRRIYVNGFRPVTDAATVYGSVSSREQTSATAVYSTETLKNAIGVCDAQVSTRYARGKVRIPAGTSWTFAAGVEPDIQLEGGA